MWYVYTCHLFCIAKTYYKNTLWIEKCRKKYLEIFKWLRLGLREQQKLRSHFDVKKKKRSVVNLSRRSNDWNCSIYQLKHFGTLNGFFFRFLCGTMLSITNLMSFFYRFNFLTLLHIYIYFGVKVIEIIVRPFIYYDNSKLVWCQKYVLMTFFE